MLRLASLAPRLQSDVLHRVISAYGLEDCVDLVAQATPAQLSRIFDLDLWRPTRPGLDEQFDSERFGAWIEVLVDAGPDLAAAKLAQIPIAQLIPGFAHHARVFDIAAIAGYETTDGERIESHIVGDDITAEIDGYRIAARRDDAWDAIVAVLIEFDEHHRERFDELMTALLSLSDEGRELDGLDDLLESRSQMMFEAARGREGRREQQGFASPAAARAFLQMSRNVHPGAVPTPNPVARAYFRSLDSIPETAVNADRTPHDETEADVTVDIEVRELLAEAGVLPQQTPRGLLTSGEVHSSTHVAEIHRRMHLVFERNPVAYGERHAELAYLTNVLMVGCSVGSRPFTVKDASDAAVAVCNLGLVRSPTLPMDYLVGHDLIGVFQIGWTVLYEEVAVPAAKTLVEVLPNLRCVDEDTRKALRRLQFSLKREVAAGTPWRAAPQLDAIALLDQVAWSALRGLIAECPVMAAALTGSCERRTTAIDADAFRFITGDADLAMIRSFLGALPDLLG